jgi:uncharacterized membrane protein
LLRTPDETAGQPAKCPQCGEITEAPSPEADEFSLAPEAPRGPVVPKQPANIPAENRPAEESEPADGRSFDVPADPDNPFASPSYTGESVAAVEYVAGELAHARITFEGVLDRTRVVYTQHFGPCLLVGLILVGIAVVGYAIFAGVIVSAVGMAALAQPRPQVFLLLNPFVFLVAIGAVLVGTWIQCGLVKLFTRMARGEQPDIADMFSGGPYFLRALGVTGILVAINIGISLGMAIPQMLIPSPAIAFLCSLTGNIVNYIISLYLFLAIYLIVDRDSGVNDSLQESIRFMEGNKFTAFLLHLVVGLVGGIAMLCTCGLGAIFVMPFIMLVNAVIYVTATGQLRGSA